ncbi:hypothetical protein EON64_19650 [archaeon]|nr:MAG: hypothetical protein EON64_19650 [archaeon]
MKHIRHIYIIFFLSLSLGKCPACNTRIEKNQGCNHMTCRICKHEFCWICSSKSYWGMGTG